MIVKQILAMKSGPDHVETVSPDDPVSRAIELLANRRIGAVVVTSDGIAPEGILSERDIVRDLARGGDTLSRKVSDLMTREVATCICADDALAVLERMTEGRFRHLPVVDADGRLIGVVSIGDAVSARLKELASEKDALTGMIMGA
ncbi:CBS domain-containing protein [Paracoccus marinus]|uniref:CBS domain-containing protein n=1 Tax=Paracoccus marinus TaxID=288426 RepID=UPI00103CC00D|nr:CBS domain-containing protein [Paracoccus marinus]GLS80073.1 inosine-5-monophosphate dehydrogenase [Paracoccus marinus]